MNIQMEYETLREEILLSVQTVKNYRSLLYTAVVALLAFAFDKDEAILFLLPFAVIIPLYLLSMHQIDSMLRIGAYIYVYLESGTECQWETRLLEYEKAHQNQYDTKKTKIEPYFAVSFLCLVFSVIHLNHLDKFFYITIILQTVILVICVYLFVRKRPDYLKTKMKYIEEWEKLKSCEQRNCESGIENEKQF